MSNLKIIYIHFSSILRVLSIFWVLRFALSLAIALTGTLIHRKCSISNDIFKKGFSYWNVANVNILLLFMYTHYIEKDEKDKICNEKWVMKAGENGGPQYYSRSLRESMSKRWSLWNLSTSNIGSSIYGCTNTSSSCKTRFSHVRLQRNAPIQSTAKAAQNAVIPQPSSSASSLTGVVQYK